MARAYEKVTDRIIAELERGAIPWRKPWASAESRGPARNATTDRPYRGINRLLLSLFGGGDPRWLTYRQAEARGGHVRKGEHGLPIVYFSNTTRRTEQAEDGTERTITTERDRPIIRHSTVFNVEQCDGLDLPPLDTIPLRDFTPIETAEAIVAGWHGSPPVAHQGERAFYVPGEDRIVLPPRETFTSDEAYYAVRFHEMTHSTGHASRLDRRGITEIGAFGSPVYSREELVAEMGAAFLCAEAGIDNATIEQHAGYIEHWIEVLRADARAVVIAAGQGEKAADLILGRGASAAMGYAA